MRRSFTAASAVALLLALTACGGGDDEPAPVAEPPAVVFTPSPAVTSTPTTTAAPTSSESPTSSPSASPGATSDAAELKIEIKDFAFSPKLTQARPGQKITVTNRDSAVHTLTTNDGSIDSGDLGRDQSYTFTAPAAGGYDYICTPHPYMKGTLRVS
ncbi:MAG: cupredoxin domain-containing protein [Sporichthyaceae bacterium]